MKIKNYLVMMLVALCAVACSDDDEVKTPTTVGDTMTIDATSYADWVYVNLVTGETQKVSDYSQWYYAGNGTSAVAKASASDVTIDWHIAFHRYNVRTNGASAVITAATTLDGLTEWPATGYAADVDIVPGSASAGGSGVITDMSGMMTEVGVGYASSGTINEVLSSAITRTGEMGAYVYTPSDKVFVVKFADGGYAKLLFTDATDAEGNSGHVTFAYEYTK